MANVRSADPREWTDEDWSVYNQEKQQERYGCECGGMFRCICNIVLGDSEGRGSEDLYQCDKCKTVKAMS